MAVDAYKSMQRVASLLKNEIEKGTKRSQLARDLDTTTASIGDWLNGKNPPGSASLRKLAERFDVSPAYLAGVDELKDGLDVGSLRVALSKARRAYSDLGKAISTLEDSLATGRERKAPRSLLRVAEEPGRYFHAASDGQPVDSRIAESTQIFFEGVDDGTDR